MAPTRHLMKGKGSRRQQVSDVTSGDRPDEEGDVNQQSGDVRSPSSQGQADDEWADCLIMQDVLSDLDLNVISSKLTLMSCSDDEGVSLYQHLSEMLSLILSFGEAGSAVDEAEAISRHLKQTRVKSATTVVRDHPRADEIVLKQWQLFKKIGREITDFNPIFGVRNPKVATKAKRVQDEEEDGGEDSPRSKNPEKKPEDDSLDARLRVLPDVMRQYQMFNMAGLGLPVTEYTRIALGMRELASSFLFKSIRFWGKILGTQQNYYIVETQLYEEDYDVVDDDNNELDDVMEDDRSPSGTSSDMSDDVIPRAYKPPPQVPVEAPGQGVNSFVYYVCNEPGLPWIRLPDVTPQQITTARQITSLFTGHLDHVHATYPPFPGIEANYLRAQVARITSGTSISPIGCFKFDEGKDEEEHDESRDACVKDEEFDGVLMRELSDASLQFWVHHVNYILPQGRTVWFNPLDAKAEEGEDEDDEEEERKEPDEPEPELPQPLLIPVSEDVDVGPSPPWTSRLSSQLVPPEHCTASLTSVRWPGAIVCATDRGRFYANLYVGWGLKAAGGANFDPALPPEAVTEFPTGSEVIEQDDPTPEEEAAIRAAMREQEESMEDEKEEEEEEGEDEEDED